MDYAGNQHHVHWDSAFQWTDASFDPTRSRHSSIDYRKKCKSVYGGGFWENGWNIMWMCISFSRNTPIGLHVGPVDGLLRVMTQNTKNHEGCAFWG